MTSSQPMMVVYGIVALAFAISMVTDLRSRQIKDVVTLPTIVLCLVVRFASGGVGTLGGEGGLSGVAGAATGFGVFWFLHRKQGLGLGDVKLMAAVGAGVGMPSILFCFIGTGMVGGIHAMVALLWRGEFLVTLKKMGLRLIRSDSELTKRPGETIAYCPAIALGSVWGVLWRIHEQSIAAAIAAVSGG